MKRIIVFFILLIISCSLTNSKEFTLDSDNEYLISKMKSGYEFDDFLLEGSICNNISLMKKALFWGCSDESILKAMINVIDYSFASFFFELEYNLISSPSEDVNLFLIVRMMKKMSLSEESKEKDFLKGVLTYKIKNDISSVESLNKILFLSVRSNNTFIPDSMIVTDSYPNKYGYQQQGSVFEYPGIELDFRDVVKILYTLKFAGYSRNISDMFTQDGANYNKYVLGKNNLN